ncbi:hypothetical protein MUK42_05097 [Musa troglodytarum]|uniref:Uncharacterized protein n=1 Tax=Musa troglodytarum TaxID=320322 RepID=A0A9E7G8Z8_9LILI|nr:hypothetical protein MUK42_05097 [Musa troglodytarum]
MKALLSFCETSFAFSRAHTQTRGLHPRHDHRITFDDVRWCYADDRERNSDYGEHDETCLEISIIDCNISVFFPTLRRVNLGGSKPKPEIQSLGIPKAGGEINGESEYEHRQSDGDPRLVFVFVFLAV